MSAESALLDEVSAAMADMVEVLRSGRECQAEVSAALVDMVELLAQRKGDAASLIEAIRGLRITVQPAVVNVPAPVVQIIERGTPGFEIVHTYDSMDRIKSSRVTPIGRE